MGIPLKEIVIMKRKNEITLSSIEQTVCILILLIFVFLSIGFGHYETNTDTAMLMDINEGWIDENGQEVDIYDLTQGRHSVILDISKLNTARRAICFKSIDTNFKVYSSEGLIYDYDPVIPRHLGISYGMQYHTITIPENSSFLRLRLMDLRLLLPILGLFNFAHGTMQKMVFRKIGQNSLLMLTRRLLSD